MSGRRCRRARWRWVRRICTGGGGGSKPAAGRGGGGAGGGGAGGAADSAGGQRAADQLDARRRRRRLPGSPPAEEEEAAAPTAVIEKQGTSFFGWLLGGEKPAEVSTPARRSSAPEEEPAPGHRSGLRSGREPRGLGHPPRRPPRLQRRSRRPWCRGLAAPDRPPITGRRRRRPVVPNRSEPSGSTTALTRLQLDASAPSRRAHSSSEDARRAPLPPSTASRSEAAGVENESSISSHGNPTNVCVRESKNCTAT